MQVVDAFETDNIIKQLVLSNSNDVTNLMKLASSKNMSDMTEIELYGPAKRVDAVWAKLATNPAQVLAR